MKVMVEFQHGAICAFTEYMEVVDYDPLVIVYKALDGKRIRLGKLRRIFTESE